MNAMRLASLGYRPLAYGCHSNKPQCIATSRYTGLQWRPQVSSRDLSSGNTMVDVALIVGAGASAILGAPYVISAAGFTQAGITAGSLASYLMSASAVANGGGVASGGIIAGLQSAGAVGCVASSTSASIGVGASGSAAGLWYWL